MVPKERFSFIGTVSPLLPDILCHRVELCLVPDTYSTLNWRAKTNAYHQVAVRSLSSILETSAFHPGADRSGSSEETPGMPELKIPFTEPRNRSRRRGSVAWRGRQLRFYPRAPVVVLVVVVDVVVPPQLGRNFADVPLFLLLVLFSPLSLSLSLSLSLFFLRRHPRSLSFRRNVSLFPFRATVTSTLSISPKADANEHMEVTWKYDVDVAGGKEGAAPRPLWKSRNGHVDLTGERHRLSAFRALCTRFRANKAPSGWRSIASSLSRRILLSGECFLNFAESWNLRTTRRLFREVYNDLKIFPFIISLIIGSK